MAFEEHFPSLKDKGADAEYGELVPPAKTGYWFDRDDLIKHCLDKQKVLESFNYIQGVIGKQGINLAFWDLIEEKKKELGLM